MRTVTVSGSGSATAVPDSAVVRVAARHRAAGVAEAFSGADSTARTATEVAARHTEPRRISSTELTVWPAYDPEPGFEARHALQIAVSSLDVAGRLLGDLVEACGDRLQVEGVTLEVSDPAAVLDAARETAFAEARRRAAWLAALADASLGEVLSVVEGGAGPSPVAPVALKAAAQEVALQPGEQTLTQSVTVTWTLTPR